MITQKTVRTIARAFGFSANWKSDYQEWRIASKAHPSDSYFTNDHADAIYTILASYRHYRNHNLVASINQE